MDETNYSPLRESWERIANNHEKRIKIIEHEHRQRLWLIMCVGVLPYFAIAALAWIKGL